MLVDRHHPCPATFDCSSLRRDAHYPQPIFVVDILGPQLCDLPRTRARVGAQPRDPPPCHCVMTGHAWRWRCKGSVEDKPPLVVPELALSQLLAARQAVAMDTPSNGFVRTSLLANAHPNTVRAAVSQMSFATPGDLSAVTSDPFHWIASSFVSEATSLALKCSSSTRNTDRQRFTVDCAGLLSFTHASNKPQQPKPGLA